MTVTDESAWPFVALQSLSYIGIVQSKGEPKAAQVWCHPKAGKARPRMISSMLDAADVKRLCMMSTFIDADGGFFARW